MDIASEQIIGQPLARIDHTPVEAATKPTRHTYSYTRFAHLPDWCDAYARALDHTLFAFREGHDTWRVRGIATFDPHRRVRGYRVTATGLRYRDLTCTCPGARDGRVCMHMALVAQRRATDAEYCLRD